MRFTLVTLTLSCLISAGAVAEDWPNWRGPDRDGQSHGPGVPTEWGPDNGVVWKLGSLAPGGGDCFDVTVRFDSAGAFEFSSTLAYEVGLNRDTVDSGSPSVVAMAMRLGTCSAQDQRRPR